MHDPNNITGFLGGGTYRPGATGAREVGGGPVPPPRPGRPTGAATYGLTVRADGDVTLYAGLVREIPHLRGHGPVDLVPPQRRGGTWHLDTRATAPRRLPAPGKVARFSIPALKREHLLRPGIAPRPGDAPREWGTVGTAGTVGAAESLAFTLGPEVEGHPGYYTLVPVG